jgi:hypothetical protein
MEYLKALFVEKEDAVGAVDIYYCTGTGTLYLSTTAITG